MKKQNRFLSIVLITLRGIYISFVYIIKLPVYIYRWCISPLIPHTCPYYPTCSKYMLIAINEWGILKGIMLGTKRILRCTPGKGGIDLVPINIKGDNKWVL